MTKFYLAGSYSRRQELAGYAYKMRFAGYEVTSSWLNREESDRALTSEGREAIALEDLYDVSCDSQDSTLQAILSNGVATVRQTLSRVFSVMAAERAKKGRKLVLTPDCNT
jgi:hypothetical protein